MDVAWTVSMGVGLTSSREMRDRVRLRHGLDLGCPVYEVRALHGSDIKDVERQ